MCFTSCITLRFVRLLLYTWCMYDTVGCVSPATLDRVMILWSFSEATAHTLKVRTGMRSHSQPSRRLNVYRFKLTRIYQLQDLYVIHTNSPYTRLL